MKVVSSSKYHPLHSRRRAIKVPFGTNRFLAAFEGMEGGFAVGASIVLALSFAALSRDVLLSTAILSIIVNGFNAASVKYSSEHYLDQLDGREKKSAMKHYFTPAAIEFVSYFLISFLSIIPLAMIDNLVLAVGLCVASTLIILGAAGYWRGFMLHMSPWRNSVEAVVLGGGIILVGLISGVIVHSL